jgi:hippurate hydrolase
MAGADFFDITVKGYGSHGAMPNFSRDPIVAAAALVTALQTIVSRNVVPLEAAVLSVTQFHGGSAHNVIPGEVRLAGTARAFSSKVRTQIRERMTAIARGVAAAYAVEIDIDNRDLFDVLENHPEHCDVAAHAAREIVGSDGVLTNTAPKMGSEDFADMLQAVPGAYFWLGHAGSVPVHNSGFVLDDGILPVGASIFARIIESRMPCQ